MIPLSEITVITPCSRPWRLAAMAKTILPTMPWIVMRDDKRGLKPSIVGNMTVASHHDERSIFGNAQRNAALAITKTRYVYFLDDDNVAIPMLFKVFSYGMEDGKALVVNQIHKNGDRRLSASPRTCRPSMIDTAQFIVPMEMIGTLRWELGNYAADGEFFSALYRNNPGQFVFLNADLCYYNYLR